MALVPEDVAQLVFVATIRKARERRQNFGIVDDAYMRVVDRDANEELARFDLSEDACVERSLVFGALVKGDDGRQFRAIGKGVEAELPEIARSLGFRRLADSSPFRRTPASLKSRRFKRRLFLFFWAIF